MTIACLHTEAFISVGRDHMVDLDYRRAAASTFFERALAVGGVNETHALFSVSEEDI